MKLCGTVLLLLDHASSCSDWIMDDSFGLSVRTMDLGPGPTFSLKTQPKGYKPAGMAVPAAKYGHIISIGANLAQPSKGSRHHLELDGIISGDAAFAGLNEAGLSCDLHALVNSSYPPRSSNASANNLMLFHFCNWALGSYATAADVRRALEAGVVHLWGPSAAERDGDPSAGDRNLCPPAPAWHVPASVPDGPLPLSGVRVPPSLACGCAPYSHLLAGVHFIVRDAKGQGLAVEFMDQSTKLYDDLNDGGEHGYGVFTNEPPYQWQLANVRHFRWKQSLARESTVVPGNWYPDERFLRIHLVKSAMPTPQSYQEAVQHALHVLNVITVPMGLQMGTDSGFGEGQADHTHYGHIYDHRNATLYWRHQTNLQLERVRLADVLRSSTPLALPMNNDLPFFHDASDKFVKSA